MLHWKHGLTLAGLLTVTALVLLACAAPAPTPTPTAKPAAAATPTKAPAATPTPTKVTIRFEGGKFQALPDGYPNKAITFFITKVGSGVDIFTRQLIKVAEPFSPVPLVPKNMSGASLDAFRAARDAEKTGYAISVVTGTLIAANYIGGYNLVLSKDYKPVVFPNSNDPIFAVKADAPWKTMKDFLDYARANPGLRIATSTPGSMHQVVCEWLAKEAGVKWACVPHDATGDAVRGILAGDFPGGQIALAPVQPQVDAGKMRIIGTSASDKLEKHPGAVRYVDLGYKTRFDDFYGVLAPGEVADTRIEWLSALFLKAIEDPEFRQWTESMGQRVIGYTADKATAMLKEIDPIVAQLTKELGMQP